MLSKITLSAMIKRMHEAALEQYDKGFADLRSRRLATFRTWAVDISPYLRDTAEMGLAHFIGSEGERAYRRGDMLEKRREMMAAWEAFLVDG